MTETKKESKFFWDLEEKNKKFWENRATITSKNKEKASDDALHLRSRVKPMDANNRGDIENVRRAMWLVGDYKGRPKEHYDGFIMDRPLRSSIEGFQKEKGLSVDGIINPGGETEQAINKDLRQKYFKSSENEGRYNFEMYGKRFSCDPLAIKDNWKKVKDISKKANVFKVTPLAVLDNPVVDEIPKVGKSIRKVKRIWNFWEASNNSYEVLKRSCDITNK